MNQLRGLIVGASGIAGQAVGDVLGSSGWQTIGVTRGSVPRTDQAVQANLLDPNSLRGLRNVDPTAVFITAWMRQSTEAENIEVNGSIVRNVLAALDGAPSLKHVALLTGLKHYLGPFEDYGTSVSAETPFREESPRLETPNFYYAQEDELFAASARSGFTWSVHRAHTVFGFATGNAMNMVLTLGAYAAICRETGEPFIFPGSEIQWNGVTDVTDAGLLGEQMLWAATSPTAANEAFNIANGDVFRWRWLWPRIAERLGVAWEGYSNAPRPLAPRMGHAGEVWGRICERHNLVERDIDAVASWWHTDSDLGRPLECFTDMTKSRVAGFNGFRSTEQSFANGIERYEDARVLPTARPQEAG